jgi:hypothetical protein
LTVRPAFLGAVRTGVANKYLRNPETTLSNDIDEELRRCGNKARENIELAKLLRGDKVIAGAAGEMVNVEGVQPLLIQELHHLFNAALILMMHQIVFINLRTKDTEGIDRAITIFTQEAEIGSVYAKDCVVVLKDLKQVVKNLRNTIYEARLELQERSPEPGPGEQILSSLVPISAGFGASSPFAVDAKAFQPVGQGQSVHGHGVTSQLSLRQYAESPEHSFPSPPTTITSPEMKEALETWAATGVTGSYTGGGCMVENRT